MTRNFSSFIWPDLLDGKVDPQGFRQSINATKATLQAATILVTMGRRKNFWQLKLQWKSPIRRPVLGAHVASCMYWLMFMAFLKVKLAKNLHEILFTFCFLHNSDLSPCLSRYKACFEISRATPNSIAIARQPFKIFQNRREVLYSDDHCV